MLNDLQKNLQQNQLQILSQEEAIKDLRIKEKTYEERINYY